MISLLLFGAALQGLSRDFPPSATIEAVQADPGRFHGRRVQLRGWVRSCGGLDCALRKTLDRGEAATLGFAHDAETDLMLSQWSPAEVIVEVRYDGTCNFGRVICMDRAPELHDVRLLRVIREGLPPGYAQ